MAKVRIDSQMAEHQEAGTAWHSDHQRQAPVARNYIAAKERTMP